MSNIPAAPSIPSVIPTKQLIKLPKAELKVDLVKDWRRIFGKYLIEGERLVRGTCDNLTKVFRCAIAKPTLMEGKLWVSDFHVCFKLNWPGQTTLVIDWSDVIDIRRQQFAGIVPNAIEIQTYRETFFFGSLSQRHEKLEDLHFLWDQFVPSNSLFRRYPDLSSTNCRCSSNSCDYCLKVLQLKIEVANNKKSNVGAFVDGNRGVSSEYIRSPTTPIEPSHFGKMESQESTTTLSDDACTCGQSDGYEFVHEASLPFNLEVLWKEYFWAPSSGNTLIRYLLGPQRITDLEIAPWASEGDISGEETVSLDKVGGGQFEPPFSTVKEGMYRQTTRVVPLNHVPKSTQGLNRFEVLRKSDSQLCISNDAQIVLMGITTKLKFCFVQVAPNQCTFKVHSKLIFTGKGKINIPRALAEKSTHEGVKAFYVDLALYLEKHVKAGDLEGCQCEDSLNSGYSLWYQSEFLPIPIKDLWTDIYAVGPGGNLCVEYLQGKVSDLSISAWSVEDPNTLVTIKDITNDPIQFEDVEIGLKRAIKYEIAPSVKNIGFGNMTKQAITGHTSHSFCIASITAMSKAGGAMDVKICAKNLGIDKTRVKIYGSIKKGNFSYPKANSDPQLILTDFYRDLFGSYLIAVRKKMAMDTALSKCEKSKSNTLQDWAVDLLKSQSKEDIFKYSVLFLLSVLLLNSLILWNLVLAAEKSQYQLAQLIRDVNNKLGV